MQFKRLGNSQLQVSPLAFGGNVIGWTINEKQSFEILDAFVAQGFNFIDTANIYCRWATGVGGESETIIGRWLRKTNNRSNIVLATKVGMDMGNGSTGLSKKYNEKDLTQPVILNQQYGLGMDYYDTDKEMIYPSLS